MIIIKNLNKSYGSKVLFSQANFIVKEKSLIAIKGQSGVGKTTLLSIIGLMENFEGDYQLDGQIIDSKKDLEKIRKSYFSYVFQQPLLIEYMNVYDNIVLPLKNKKQKVNQEMIEQCLNLLGISSLKEQLVAHLSGGEKQRVSIARAVAANTKIILADEPTGNLDELNGHEVMKLLKKVQENYGVTILMVTHSNQLDAYFDHIFSIQDKKIIEVVK